MVGGCGNNRKTKQKKQNKKTTFSSTHKPSKRVQCCGLHILRYTLIVNTSTTRLMLNFIIQPKSKSDFSFTLFSNWKVMVAGCGSGLWNLLPRRRRRWKIANQSRCCWRSWLSELTACLRFIERLVIGLSLFFFFLTVQMFIFIDF
jgi:hypothetical protein